MRLTDRPGALPVYFRDLRGTSQQAIDAAKDGRAATPSDCVGQILHAWQLPKMHELYATQAILEKALGKAAEANANRITGLHIVIGDISTYSEDSVKFYWEEIRKGTAAEGAELHFRHVSTELQCMACFTKYQPAGDEILCPQCGSSGAKVLAGEEFYMEALDVE